MPPKPNTLIAVVGPTASGKTALAIALASGEGLPGFLTGAGALCLGFVAYGLSIFFYVYAQRHLGAARTSAYYAVAPFIGAFLSLLMFRQWPERTFWIALPLMLLGTYFASVKRADAA